MTWEIYTADQLSNEDYQEHPAVSGSGLATIYKQSPAHFKYGEKQESKALAFGIAAHAILLEPDSFDAEFVRDVDPEQYPDSLVTQNDLKAWLKERGGKVSGSKPELIERIQELEPDTHIWDVIKHQFAEDNASKTIMKPDDFDAVGMMRNAVLQDSDMGEMLKGGAAEFSLIGELGGVEVKVRPDLITSAGGIVQYKTTQSCHPAEFGRKAEMYGYLLKAALEWECFTAAYGREPAYYIFVAQEKTAPYMWAPYAIGSDSLEIGRVQLQTALDAYKRCLDTNQWPGYGFDVKTLILPEYLKKEYNV